MIISNNCSSRFHNTFGVDANIHSLITITDSSDLKRLQKFLADNECLILGGGSNILITKDINIPLIKIATSGVQIVKEEEQYVLARIAAGEIWHDMVLWAVSRDYAGIENLALIPGKCGAAPMQNIGAYGVELVNVLHSLRAYRLEDGKTYTFHREECGLGYRQSHFKGKWKGQFIITDITLRLSKPGYHILNTSYGAINAELEKEHIVNPSIQDICKAVITIRQRKLPDPLELGNAGSFFKNPIIPQSEYLKLKNEYESIPSYFVSENSTKVPAGWLIDQCGWKGHRKGNAGVYKHQALVLVNHGVSSGKELYDLSTEIKASVKEKFSIELEREVNIW